jgi:hypothetical protein
MSTGLDEIFPPTPEVWAELAQHEMAGDHQFGRAVLFLEEGGTDHKLLAERLGIKVDYAAWLLTHARKMKQGIIRVVVSEKNDGRETANNQAHHYRYVLDDDLTPDTRRFRVRGGSLMGRISCSSISLRSTRITRRDLPMRYPVSSPSAMSRRTVWPLIWRYSAASAMVM